MLDTVVGYCLMMIAVWGRVALRFSKIYKDYINPMSFLIYMFLLNNHVKMIATRCGIFGINSNGFGTGLQLLALLLSDCGMLVISVAYSRFMYSTCGYDKSYMRGISSSFLFFGCIFFACGLIAYGATSYMRMFSLSTMQHFRIYRHENALGNGMQIVWVNLMTISIISMIYFIVVKSRGGHLVLVKW